jgi:hypothetical protein
LSGEFWWRWLVPNQLLRNRQLVAVSLFDFLCKAPSQPELYKEIELKSPISLAGTDSKIQRNIVGTPASKKEGLCGWLNLTLFWTRAH